MLELIKKKLPIICVTLMAIGQFLCASGSGSLATADPLPDWVNNMANFFNVAIGLGAFIPRMRVRSAVLSVLITVASIAINYLVDGYDYFLQVLAFDLVLIGVSLIVYFHYWRAPVGFVKGRRV